MAGHQQMERGTWFKNLWFLASALAKAPGSKYPSAQRELSEWQ